VGMSFLFSTPGASAVMEGSRYAKAPYATAPVMSVSPWEGLYAGGHAGAAWGNRTDGNYSDSNIIVSDTRLKRDIALMGRRQDGLGIYSYRYLWSDAVYVGVIAQEVALVYPNAVVRDPLNGYLGVDYARLGLHLMRVAE
ncbi:MAG: hypothetical protein JWO48_498, partial [Bryobacterales bacterium]|nr:hypothetical protein [Bryobacterales bacterium]